MKIAVLGSGIVGQTLANGLKEAGHEVIVGSRKAGAVENWQGATATFSEATESAELVVLAVKGAAAERVVEGVRQHLSGKTVIDTTNPIADEPSTDGVLSYFTSLSESLMERLQLVAVEANFVKAFNSVGSGMMVNPKYEAGKPTMFICGNNIESKKQVSEILHNFGWDVEDMGRVAAARAIEPLCMLWCIPGMLHNEWTHAFKLLRR